MRGNAVIYIYADDRRVSEECSRIARKSAAVPGFYLRMHHYFVKAAPGHTIPGETIGRILPLVYDAAGGRCAGKVQGVCCAAAMIGVRGIGSSTGRSS